MGAPKGHRKYGGRRKGQTNLATRERQAAIAIMIGRGAADDRLSRDGLIEVCKHFKALAARHQGKNERLFSQYMKMYGDFCAKLAPYQLPTMSAVAVIQQPPLRPEELSDDGLRAAIRIAGEIASAGGVGSGTLKTIN